MYYIGDEEIKALKELFERKKLFRYQVNTQSECDFFETEFSQYLGTQRSLLLTSGTNALILALRAAAIGAGDEVLIPAYTFVATAAAVLQVGATPIVVNIDSKLSICCEDAKKKITTKTKALIAVHMDGLAANMDGIMNLSQKHNFIIIEDVAQAIGGSYKTKKLGSLGLVGCYSLNENKNISCGEGGALTTNDLKIYETAFRLHDTPVQFSPTRKESFKNTIPEIGYSMRASEIQGTIMRVQLSRLDFIIHQLNQRKTIFKDKLINLKNTTLILGHCESGDCGSSLHLCFEDIEKAHNLSQKLRAQGLAFFPVTSRPAHAVWNWMHLLPEKIEQSQFIDSIEILSRTYKMSISLDWSLEKTNEAAEATSKILKDF